jgi:hypothetical protein
VPVPAALKVLLAVALVGAGLPAGAQTRTGGINTGPEALTGPSAAASPGSAWEIYDAGPELAANALLAAKGSPTLRGEFSVFDWKGYPGGVAKPSGPFRLLQGAEYDAARAAANKANAALRAADPAKYTGKQIHEIQPVKFGGSPTDPANKIALTPPEHAQYTTFWNRLMRDLQ